MRGEFSLKMVIGLAIALLVVTTLVLAFVGFGDDISKAFEESLGKSDVKADEASCSVECNEKYPVGDSRYDSCLEGCKE